jgi:hypothetical protein
MANGPGCAWCSGDDRGLSAQVRQGFPGSSWTPVDGFALLDTHEARGSNPLRPTLRAPSFPLGVPSFGGRPAGRLWSIALTGNSSCSVVCRS